MSRVFHGMFYDYHDETLQSQEAVDTANSKRDSVRPYRIGDTIKIQTPRPFIPYDPVATIHAMRLAGMISDDDAMDLLTEDVKAGS